MNNEMKWTQDGVLQAETRYEKRDHLYVEQEKFYDSILNKSPVFVGIEDGVWAMKVLDQISQFK